MHERQIKNFEELATTENRAAALEIAEAGFAAINTERIVLSSLKLEGDILSVKGERFDLSKFKRIKVVGFGKASSDAALALEKVLGGKISEGIVIGLTKTPCNIIETLVGTHPRPSRPNFLAGKKIYDIADDSHEDDLIIAIVSGGGSALLCYPESECEQGALLYDESVKMGYTIDELNTIRKHLSLVKGGGLAKIAYPATVIGLIFSDVPGIHPEKVASGPTYKDETTIDDIRKIIKADNIGGLNLFETPKEDKYFEKVRNFVLVSNVTAVDAMARKAEAMGFASDIISTELYDDIDAALKKILDAKRDHAVVLAAGEPSVKVTKKGGSGGRNLYMGLKALGRVGEHSVLVLLASDGMDNSDAGGAIVDKITLEKFRKSGLDLDKYIDDFNAYPVFQKLGDMIMTGPTGANVSDLMILLTDGRG